MDNIRLVFLELLYGSSDPPTNEIYGYKNAGDVWKYFQVGNIGAVILDAVDPGLRTTAGARVSRKQGADLFLATKSLKLLHHSKQIF